MYGFYDVVDIQPQQLLQKISQEKLFEYVLGQPFSFDKNYDSPVREHSKGKGTGKCRFERRPDGTILFVDFGDTRQTHRTCLGLLMVKTGWDMELVIRHVAETFGLSTHSSDYKPLADISYENEERKRADILYTPRVITKLDIQFWRKFYIESYHLSEDNTNIVESFTTINKGKQTRFTPFKYCYVFDFHIHVKIYQPFSTNYKFISNCDQDDIGNINGISEKGEKLIVAKSYKDHRVIRNIWETKDVIWLQNEGCIPSDFILISLLDRFETIVIFYDNDYTGIAAAYKLYRHMKFLRPSKKVEIKYVPIRYTYKDPSDFAKAEGKKDTIKLFNQIKL